MKVGEKFSPYKLFVGIHIPSAILKVKGLSPGAKVIWGRLAQYAGENGEAYPKIETLGEETGMSGRQASTYLKELRKNGWLEVERTGKSNKYYFVWQEIFEEALRVKKVDRKDASDQIGRMLPNGSEGCFRSGEAPESLPDKASQAENGTLRESINENQLSESGDHSQNSSSNSKNGIVDKACGTWRDIFYQHKGYKPTITTQDYKALERLINQHGYDQVEILLNEYVLNANQKEANEAGYALSWLPGAANRLLKGRADRQAAEAEAKKRKMNRLITEILYMGYDSKQNEIDELTPEDKAKLIEIVEHNANLPEYQHIVSNWRDQGAGADG